MSYLFAWLLPTAIDPDDRIYCSRSHYFRDFLEIDNNHVTHHTTHQHVSLCVTIGDLKVATNLALDDDLIKEALSIGQQKTKKAVVTEALKEYIQRRKQLEVIQLFGTLDYDEEYNYKRQRKVKCES